MLKRAKPVGKSYLMYGGTNFRKQYIKTVNNSMEC